MKIFYLLKSHCSICQEAFVKKPAEENIQTEKIQGKKGIIKNIYADKVINVQIKHSIALQEINKKNLLYLLSPREGSNRTMKIKKE